MRLIDRYILPPGCCQKCRSAQRADEDLVLDTLVSITDGIYDAARLYLCRSCSVEIAQLWRFSPPEVLDKICAERDAAILHVREMEEELAALREIRSAIERFVPAPAVELAATKPYFCVECDREFQNPAAFGRHNQAKHQAPHWAPRRGDEALDGYVPPEGPAYLPDDDPQDVDELVDQ